jgi:VIT1/CCC1 family predicted Fe2+/Mn2+ transporter
MRGRRRHAERHFVSRVGWLRAAVLGADDGLLSTSSLMIGVAAASVDLRHVLISGAAGLIAGAMSMAAGEYVSVSSQADAEAADLERERQELEDCPEAERRELAGIYMKRGVERGLALEVADQLMARDALAAHARDELGLSDAVTARPIQAAIASACSFAAGALVPLITTAIAGEAHMVRFLFAVTLVCLATLGALGARAGGAPMVKGALRVLFWGAFAMAVTAAVGRTLDATVF